MKNERKNIIISIIVTVLVVGVSSLSFVYANNNNLLNKVNEEVDVDINISKTSTVINASNEVIYLENNLIQVKNKDDYHYKILLDSNNNHNGKVTYSIKLNDIEIVPEKEINLNSNEAFELYEGFLPKEGSVFNIIIKAYSYDESTKMDNNIYFVY